ncbi:MAG: RloB family protein [Lactobacillaceae bacterium]|jgi:hypothetical protein|nr:RloB family protein [Lactobacillaceae bacterium]
MARRSRNLRIKPIIAIYCEGDSEKAYFEMLKHKYHSANVHPEKINIKPMGKQGMDLLTTAVTRIQRLPQRKQVDQAYVVFDRDDLTVSELQKCESYAKDHQIKIIFSSVNIEIWILMHFQPVMRAFTRPELNRILSGEKYFDTDYAAFKGCPYDELLVDRVKIAKSNADKLLQVSPDPWYNRNPYTNINTYLTEIFGVTEF